MLNFNVLQRTLTDIRDGETYRVRKLADGNVWMTENLRKSFTEGEVLTPATTDVTENTTVTLATQPHNQSSTNNYEWGLTDATISQVEPYNPTKEQQDKWLSRGSLNTTGNRTESQITSGANPGDVTGENQKLGIYYNWYTATAGTGTWDTGDNIEATSSICPLGWQLPKHETTKGSLWYLIKTAYGLMGADGDNNSNAVDALQLFPFSMPYPGYVASTWGHGQTSNTGDSFGLWSSKSTTTIHARSFMLYLHSYVYTNYVSVKLDGLSVRCVVK